MKIVQKFSIPIPKQITQNTTSLNSRLKKPETNNSTNILTKLNHRQKQQSTNKSDSNSKFTANTSTDTSFNSLKSKKLIKKPLIIKQSLTKINQTNYDSNHDFNEKNNQAECDLIYQIFGYAADLKVQQSLSSNKTPRLVCQTARPNQKNSNKFFRQSSYNLGSNSKFFQEYPQDSNLRKKFLQLFDLYVKQQIIKHYCEKTGWKYQTQYEINQNHKIKNKSRLIETIVLPTLELLAIRKQDLKEMFQPFLNKITKIYLLKTEIDIYFRHNPQFLLIEITQIWVKIKQAQIALKRQIRQNLKCFKKKFCNFPLEQVNGQKLESQICQLADRKDKVILNRQKLYKFIFKGSKDIKMVNLIKIFIFMHKVFGDNFQNCLLEWLQKY